MYKQIYRTPEGRTSYSKQNNLEETETSDTGLGFFVLV